MFTRPPTGIGRHRPETSFRTRTHGRTQRRPHRAGTWLSDQPVRSHAVFRVGCRRSRPPRRPSELTGQPRLRAYRSVNSTTPRTARHGHRLPLSSPQRRRRWRDCRYRPACVGALRSPTDGVTPARCHFPTRGHRFGGRGSSQDRDRRIAVPPGTFYGPPVGSSV